VENKIKCLDHGFVKLLNISSAIPREYEYEEINTDGTEEGVDIAQEFSARDIDPAICARISFDNFEEERTEEQDLRLVEYLIANKHNTPLEMTETWWQIKVPMAIGEQILRHRTACINKISGRYATLEGEWYIPEPEKLGIKSKSNKQGRDIVSWDSLEEAQKETALAFIQELREHNEIGYNKYLKFLENGIAPEVCRFFLQANHYTVFIYKQDLHNLMHFLGLRLDSHAQYENRVVAEAMYTYLIEHLPETMKLFDKYRRM
jgi:thymidylate synthase (FAD)